jgi:hypothetical protein
VVKRLIGWFELKKRFENSTCCEIFLAVHSAWLTRMWEEVWLRTGLTVCTAAPPTSTPLPTWVFLLHRAITGPPLQELGHVLLRKNFKPTIMVYGFEEVEGATKNPARVHLNVQTSRQTSELSSVKGWGQQDCWQAKGMGDLGHWICKASSNTCSQEKWGPRCAHHISPGKVLLWLRAAFGEHLGTI